MAKGLYKLTARQVAAFKGPGRLSDGGGLWLNGHKNGSISWLFLFTIAGKRREMGLGSVNAVSLAAVRRAADAARALVHAKIDPIADRKEHEKLAVEVVVAVPTLSFGTFADAYIERLDRNPKTLNNWRRTIKVHFEPIRHLPLDAIGLAEVDLVIRPLMKAMPVSGDKALTYLRKILASAKVQGLRSGDNPAIWVDNLDQIILDKAKPLAARGHHMALPYREMPEFVARLKMVGGNGARALRFLILTAMRATEVAGARWGEFNLDGRVWTVPGDRMKMGVTHRVALSKDAISLLRDLPRAEEASPEEFLFPGLHRDHIDAMTMTRVLTRMKIKARSTVHGFRSTFRDWVGEATEFDAVLAEIALAHKVGSDVERAYSRGDALEKRLVLMDAWADYCAGRTRPALRAA